MRLGSRTVATGALLAVLTGACAPPPRPPALQPATATAQATAKIDALEQRGCFTCLQQAYDAAVAASDPTRTFEIALLLAARSKELGLPFAEWFDRAAAMTPTGPEWADYLAIVRSLRIDPLSGDRDVILTETMKTRASPEMVTGWRTDLASGGGSPLFRSYLELSLICQYIVQDRNVTIAEAVQRFHDVPLMEYRAGLCGPAQAPHL